LQHFGYQCAQGADFICGVFFWRSQK